MHVAVLARRRLEPGGSRVSTPARLARDPVRGGRARGQRAGLGPGPLRGARPATPPSPYRRARRPGRRDVHRRRRHVDLDHVARGRRGAGGRRRPPPRGSGWGIRRQLRQPRTARPRPTAGSSGSGVRALVARPPGRVPGVGGLPRDAARQLRPRTRDRPVTVRGSVIGPPVTAMADSWRALARPSEVRTAVQSVPVAAVPQAQDQRVVGAPARGALGRLGLRCRPPERHAARHGAYESPCLVCPGAHLRARRTNRLQTTPGSRGAGGRPAGRHGGASSRRRRGRSDAGRPPSRQR